MMARAWSSVLGSGLCLAFLGCSATSGGTGVDGTGNGGSGSNGSGGAQPNLGGMIGTGSSLAIGGTE